MGVRALCIASCSARTRPYNTRTVATILVGYRDDDGAAHANRLRGSLLQEMSHVQVLLEEASDRPNTWRRVIDEVDLILAIVAPTQHAPAELPAANDRSDPLVTLVDEALGRGVQVIPVLIRGATLPASLDPAKLASVVELRHVRWGPDVRTIVDAAERVLAGLGARSAHLGDSVRSAPAGGASAKGSLERLRRRYIPHDRTWRFILRTATVMAGFMLVAVAVFAYRWQASAPMRQVESSTRRLAEAAALESAQTALNDLQRVVASAKDPAVENLAVQRLRNILLDTSAHGADSRQIRLLALTGIQTLRRNDVTRDFAGDELNNADLRGAKLSGIILRGVRLGGARLAGALLDGADLSGADLSAAYIAHASVRGAKFSGADFTELDWFNAVGFTDSQLSSVDLVTLERCPTDGAGGYSVEAFQRRFDDEYTGGYQALSKTLQDWLSTVWGRYRAPAGMCDVVDRLLVSRN